MYLNILNILVNIFFIGSYLYKKGNNNKKDFY